MYYVGLDYHKTFAKAIVMDDEGQIVREEKIPTQKEQMVGFLKGLPQNSKLVLEATSNWYAFADWAEETGIEITLAHPTKTRAIAEARIKTDRLDATMLAHLLRSNLVARAYLAPQRIRRLRELLRYRASLTQQRKLIKQKLRGILLRLGVDCPYSNILGQKARDFLTNLKAPWPYGFQIEGYLRLGDYLLREVEEITKEIVKVGDKDRTVKQLMTIPGLGYYGALLIRAEIGDITRFSSGKKLCSYAGLVPSVYSSGGKTRYGKITKQGSKWLRWILIQAVPHARRANDSLEILYQRVKKKHGKNGARIAVARKLLLIIYAMLKKGTKFGENKSLPTSRAYQKTEIC